METSASFEARSAPLPYPTFTLHVSRFTFHFSRSLAVSRFTFYVSLCSSVPQNEQVNVGNNVPHYKFRKCATSPLTST